MEIPAFILKFLKFGTVGATGIVVDFGATYIGKEVLKTNKYIANSLGFTAASINNYVLNRIWTFSSEDPQVFEQFLKFFGISAIGLVFNNIIIWFFHDKLKLNFYLSKLLAIGIVFFWNFFANYLYTFTA